MPTANSISSIKPICCEHAVSGDAFCFDNLHDGNKQNFEVKPKTEVVDIPDVVFEFFCPADGVSAVHLGPAGDAWSHVMAARLFGRVEGDVFHEQGAWSHERHVAAQHVDQLRDFIQRCIPDNLAHGGK